MAFRRVNQRENRLAIKAQLEGLCALAGKPAPVYETHIPEKRGPAKRTDMRPERLILADVLRFLRKHPNVAVVWREQSGLFQMDDRPIRVGTVGKPDIIGMLRGGVFFAIEVKSERGILSDSQAYWLETIRYFGGRAGVARNTEDAEKIIERVA